MGIYLTKFLDAWSSKGEKKILMLGLDAAGKSTILYQLKLAEATRTVPTVGFNVESVEYRNINFTIWDVGGQDKLRRLWVHYFAGTHALIFVVDSNDTERIEIAREELFKLAHEDELKNAVILIFANKQDLPNAMTCAEITDKLNLRVLRRRWFVQSCQATTGKGLYEGLDWIRSTLDNIPSSE